MKANNTLYLTQSKHQIWYYQRWVPIQFRHNNPQCKKIFRISLHTRDVSKAKIKSRFISVKIDELALKYFDNPKDFGKGMELLYKMFEMRKYNNLEYFDYEDALNLGISDDDINFSNYKRASEFKDDIFNEFEKIGNEVLFLKKALLNSENGSSRKSNEQLLSEMGKMINPPISEKENPFLSDLFEKWKQEKKDNIVKTSLHAYSTEINFFIRIMDDCHHEKTRLLDMTSDYCREYINIYKKIPTRTITKNYKISELKTLSGKLKSSKTIRDTFKQVKTFLIFINDSGFKFDNRVLGTISGAIKKTKNSKDKNVRLIFTCDDLTKLFNSEKYISTGKFTTTAMYWVPLLALYTGARMSELLQLQKNDIIKKENIWIIDFNSKNNNLDPDKRLKEKGSYRQVPIHKQLIKLGFIKFVDNTKERLFSDEHRNPMGKFREFQGRFATYRAQVNVLPQGGTLLDFHSFRHTVRDLLSQLGMSGKSGKLFSVGTIDEIVGHASVNRSQGDITYTHSQHLEIKKMAVNQLEYPSIDFSKIKPWYNCDPWRKDKRDAIQKKKSKKSTG